MQASEGRVNTLWCSLVQETAHGTVHPLSREDGDSLIHTKNHISTLQNKSKQGISSIQATEEADTQLLTNSMRLATHWTIPRLILGHYEAV